MVLVIGLTLPIAAAPLVSGRVSDLWGAIIIGGIALAGVVTLPLGVWLLLSTGNRSMAIYLRAFRSDRPARNLRNLLKAALGGHVRLCGIRPPRRRSRLLSRVFALGLAPLRYAGSRYFELEAEDHNWMARLIASYARTRFVFIDVREVTPHVENEIRLSYLAMGKERCIFIIDSTRTETDWLAIIRSVLALPLSDQLTLQLLSYPGDANVDPKSFVHAVRIIVDHLPEGPPAISDEAIAFARKHVADNQWTTPFRETDAGAFFSALGIAALPAIGMNALNTAGLLPGNVVDVILLLALIVTVVTVVVLYVFYFVAWARAWKQGGMQARFRRPTERSPRWRLALSLLLILLFSGAFPAAAIHKFSTNVDSARNIRVAADIQSVKAGLKLYESMNGFLPTTEQGLHALVTQPSTNPRPTRWYQLFQENPRDPWGNNYIYLAPGRKNPTEYDLYSAGPDRRADTADDNWGE